MVCAKQSREPARPVALSHAVECELTVSALPVVGAGLLDGVGRVESMVGVCVACSSGTARLRTMSWKLGAAESEVCRSGRIGRMS